MVEVVVASESISFSATEAKWNKDVNSLALGALMELHCEAC